MNKSPHSMPSDLICLSHLRWNFVFQRPQHLMSRFARKYRVFFVEEPLFGEAAEPSLTLERCSRTGVYIATPWLPESVKDNPEQATCELIRELIRSQHIHDFIAWFYTPMALDCIPDEFAPSAVIYDCMDELSMFKNPPGRLLANEERLLKLADLVFTGGMSLFEYKYTRHSRVFACPSGVDVQHFGRARSIASEHPDQADISYPRVGFAGVIDERMNLDLVRDLAALRPEWQFVFIGPVVKIGRETLPQAPNLHWLGQKPYDDLPRFFARWDAALMPFALNDATRFISPTKTPEFLSAGLQVVSTPIRDVVRPYAELGLVHIAQTAQQFAAALEQAMRCGMTLKWRERADAFLKTLAWEDVWEGMNARINGILPSENAQGDEPSADMLIGQEEARV